ncbi:FAD-binding molybdopterin dehydrogenase [Rhizobium sp. Root708]|uniref:FAD binding domain-containing protein n=1 Tax=Rhizobium sp. Root708 TaxID=1736592 RepID=UPI0006F89865|nr:xanthine dehydrogenase family protein subunit M [Rhizobium sp. Root708]KRB49057.1 FAD-binding molybdopterin dehydrogenase [Rhizobium sp. Root708]
MRSFDLLRVATLDEAIRSGAVAGRTDSDRMFIGGGTDMIQLLREDVVQPKTIVSLGNVLDKTIKLDATGLSVGAGATMAELSSHALVQERYPLIVDALLNSASPQVRNQATIAGNLLQRTRCPYFRDTGCHACNKRAPGSGCAAIGGANRWHALLGTSEHCIATHASDLAVALVALGATVSIKGPSTARHASLQDFYQLPGTTPHIEATLMPGELIDAIIVPPAMEGLSSSYIKVRDRASFEFAVVSAAVALDVDGGLIRQARVAVGGVATRPWRLPLVEDRLRGLQLEEDCVRSAADAASRGAVGRGDNDFKIDLMKRAIVRAVQAAGGIK